MAIRLLHQSSTKHRLGSGIDLCYLVQKQVSSSNLIDLDQACRTAKHGSSHPMSEVTGDLHVH
jgi:hypothetical protein